ncbi:uncharacterized protein LOC108032933 isoform X3 [Drosophila biarmipes]|uniref:uncharacterized protein LOC108032933 isoform X3 n=1 Tax=Drosophila biarmipes TaxID=125945 RepID=UPI0007E81107|nr:uncharacterized protein LOC108032933 isoform X3 [Drosophila biarmipes]
MCACRLKRENQFSSICSRRVRARRLLHSLFPRNIYASTCPRFTFATKYLDHVHKRTYVGLIPYTFNSGNRIKMLFEKDNIVFDEEENEMNTLDIYENERQGKVYPYPFFLADDDTWYRNDDVFSVACPEAIPITQKPEAAHTRIGTTHATHATPADDLPNPISAELIICDSSSSDGADVVAIQNPVTSTLKRSASSSVAHKHSQKIILQKRHSTRDTPEYIRQFLPFEMFKQAFKRSDTSQLEIEEDKSVTSAVSGSVSCVTTKKTLNAEVPDPSFGEIEILTIDQICSLFKL